MSAFRGLMGQVQGEGMQATPAHHIIEEKVNPRTGKKEVVGSDWRRRAKGFYDRMDAEAMDENKSPEDRHQSRAMASDALTDVGEEDFIHQKLASGSTMSQAQDELARLKAERGDIRSGYNSGFGMSRDDASKRGYQPPKPQGF